MVTICGKIRNNFFDKGALCEKESYYKRLDGGYELVLVKNADAGEWEDLPNKSLLRLP